MATMYSGWLTKEGGNVRNWKKRWFVLDRQDRLKYFKTQSSSKPAGMIDMTACTSVICASQCTCEWDPTCDQRLGFGIVTPKRTYHIFAETIEEMFEWMTHFRRAARLTKALPIGSPVTDGVTDEQLKSVTEQHKSRGRILSMSLANSHKDQGDQPAVTPRQRSATDARRARPMSIGAPIRAAPTLPGSIAEVSRDTSQHTDEEEEDEDDTNSEAEEQLVSEPVPKPARKAPPPPPGTSAKGRRAPADSAPVTPVKAPVIAPVTPSKSAIPIYNTATDFTPHQSTRAAIGRRLSTTHQKFKKLFGVKSASDSEDEDEDAMVSTASLGLAKAKSTAEQEQDAVVAALQQAASREQQQAGELQETGEKKGGIAPDVSHVRELKDDMKRLSMQMSAQLKPSGNGDSSDFFSEEDDDEMEEEDMLAD
eukprot:m.363460 g.363460  ORF g.363460 m.363460 type:complete len:423 (+) comp22686_c0_seq1:170-1438(+)